MTDNSEPSPLSPPTAHPKPGRRSQEERSAETRVKVVEAAIRCLHRLGYGATLLNSVAKEAGVSKGGMTHQFPSKVDLMVAVLRHTYELDIAAYGEMLADCDASEKLFALPAASWEVMSRPSGVAAIEIMMATRSDPELAERVKILQVEIERDARARIVGFIDAAGFVPHEDVGAMHRLLVAAMRGLAIDALFIDRDDEVRGALNLIVRLLRTLYDGADRKAEA